MMSLLTGKADSIRGADDYLAWEFSIGARFGWGIGKQPGSPSHLELAIGSFST